jgi:superfamily II DNA or RNA helicase
MKIKSIKKIEYNGDVYNLRIKSPEGTNHNYFANNINVANCHTAKAATVKSVLARTFGTAYMRIGMTGTFPDEESAEYLMIQSVSGPKINEVGAVELAKKGIITPMQVRAIILNHLDEEFRDSIHYIKSTGGNGRKVLDFEKQYIQRSKKRMDFIIEKILKNIKHNTLLLFFNIEYGKSLYENCRNRLDNAYTYYIDGGVNGDKREWIKDEMKNTDKPRILVASYGTLSTGVSIKSIKNLVLCDSFKSEQVVIQSIGRALRLHKDKDRALIFDLVDVFDDKYDRHPNFLYKHYLERKKFYDRREYPNDVKVVNL